MDNLIVLGTDEQLDLARVKLEVSNILPDSISKTENYALRNYLISNDSSFTGLSIENSNLRENYQALVIGIERNGSRIMNPARNFLFQSGDIVWIVGEKNKLDQIQF